MKTLIKRQRGVGSINMKGDADAYTQSTEEFDQHYFLMLVTSGLFDWLAISIQLNGRGTWLLWLNIHHYGQWPLGVNRLRCRLCNNQSSLNCWRLLWCHDCCNQSWHQYIGDLIA
uniref:Uncharacterized protein n=1 Tax=Romanomermis culicivorax TaxID=13658 RepID=A0A915I7Y3_ROMCU